MEFGKLKNGVLIHAPATYTATDGTVKEFVDNELMDYGYKPILPINIDYDSTCEKLEEYYTEDNSAIYINYTVKKIDVEQYRKELIEKSKENLAEYLAENPLKSNVSGKEELYTVTLEKQNQLTTMTVLISTGILEKPFWNAQGQACAEWEKGKFLQLVGEINAYVLPIVEKQRNMEVQIRNAAGLAELKEVNINFD